MKIRLNKYNKKIFDQSVTINGMSLNAFIGLLQYTKDGMSLYLKREQSGAQGKIFSDLKQSIKNIQTIEQWIKDMQSVMRQPTGEIETDI